MTGTQTKTTTATGEVAGGWAKNRSKKARQPEEVISFLIMLGTSMMVECERWSVCVAICVP